VNIAGVVDVPAVAEYARSLPYVDFVSENLFSCSQDNQDNMDYLYRKLGLYKIPTNAKWKQAQALQ